MSSVQEAPSRWRFLLRGFAVIMLLAIGFAALVLSSLNVNLHQPGAIRGLLGYLASVLAAPGYFMWVWLRGESIPTSTMVIAFAAVVPLFAHPIFRRRWAAAITITGLGFWLLATMIVAGGPI